MDDSAATELIPESLASETQTTFGGGCGDLHGIGDLRERQARKMMQSECLPLFIGNLREQFLYKIGHLADVGLFGRRENVSGNSRKNIVVVLSSSPHSPQQQIVRTAADIVNQQVPADAVHPAAKPADRQIVPRLTVHPQQRLLRQILGQLSIPGVALEKPDQRSLISLDQFFERPRVATLDADHQLIVIRFVTGMRGTFGHRVETPQILVDRPEHLPRGADRD